MDAVVDRGLLNRVHPGLVGNHPVGSDTDLDRGLARGSRHHSRSHHELTRNFQRDSCQGWQVAFDQPGDDSWESTHADDAVI